MSEIPTISEYSLWKGRIRCCLHWVLMKSYVPQKSSTFVLADANSLFDARGIKKSIEEEFTNGNIYIDLVKNLFETDEDISSLDELFEFLTQLRFYDDATTAVTKQSITHQPINLECHVEFIEMIMSKWLNELNLIEKITSSINRISDTTKVQSVDVKLKTLLKQWINEVVDFEKRRFQHGDDEGWIDQSFPMIKSLEDVYDGKALCLILHHYCPDKVHIEDISLNEPISLADSWHNLELLLNFYNNYLVPSQSSETICPAIKPSVLNPEDILYYDTELKISVLIFISNLFVLLERKLATDPPEKQNPKISNWEDTRSEANSMISETTRRSFLQKQSDTLSSNVSSTPDIYRSSLFAQSRPLLSRRHVAQRPATTEEINNRNNSNSIRERPHTTSVFRSHPLRKSSSLQDIKNPPSPSTDNLSTKARWSLKREQIAAYKRKNWMGDSQSTQSSTDTVVATDSVVNEAKPSSSVTTLLSNVEIEDSDNDSNVTYTVKPIPPLTTDYSSGATSDSTFTVQLPGATYEVSPDRSKTPTKTPSHSSYIVNDGFKSVESAKQAGLPVISARGDTTYQVNQVDEANVSSSDESSDTVGGGEVDESNETEFVIKPRVTNWQQIANENMMRKNASPRKLRLPQHVTKQLKEKRARMRKEEQDREKNRLKKLLKIRMELYIYGMNLMKQDGKAGNQFLPETDEEQVLIPFGATSARLYVNSETQTSQMFHNNHYPTNTINTQTSTNFNQIPVTPTRHSPVKQLEEHLERELHGTNQDVLKIPEIRQNGVNHNDVTMSYNSFCEYNGALSNHSTPCKINPDKMNHPGKENINEDEQPDSVDVLKVAEVSRKGGKGFEILTEKSPMNELARKKEQFLLKQLRKEEDMKKRKVEREALSEKLKEEHRLKQEEIEARKEEERLKRQQRLEDYKRRKEAEQKASQISLKPGLISSAKKVHQEGSKSSREPSRKAPLVPKNQAYSTDVTTVATNVEGHIMLSSGDFISNRLKFSPKRISKSQNHIHEIGHDWEVASNASSGTSEYTGPKLYKQLSTKSNRHLIINAITHCCLPGKVNEATRLKAMEALENSDARHIMVLFRDSKCQYRAIYNYDPETETLHKINGNGPASISPTMIESLYKYNSGRKGFTIVHSKTLSVGIDAITIKSNLWQSAKKPSSVASANKLRKNHS